MAQELVPELVPTPRLSSERPESTVNAAHSGKSCAAPSELDRFFSPHLGLRFAPAQANTQSRLRRLRMRNATSSSKDRAITETVPKVPYLSAIRVRSRRCCPVYALLACRHNHGSYLVSNAREGKKKGDFARICKLTSAATQRDMVSDTKAITPQT